MFFCNLIYLTQDYQVDLLMNILFQYSTQKMSY